MQKNKNAGGSLYTNFSFKELKNKKNMLVYYYTGHSREGVESLQLAYQQGQERPQNETH